MAASISTDAESNSDYLTMKPVHRAKPFMARGAKSSSKEPQSEGKHFSILFNKFSLFLIENPPPPPQHRTPLLGHSSKLYDNPTDANENEEDDEDGTNPAQ